MIGDEKLHIDPQVRCMAIPTLDLRFERKKKPFVLNFNMEKLGELTYAVLTVMAASQCGSPIVHTVKLVDGEITMKCEKETENSKAFIIDAKSGDREAHMVLKPEAVEELCDAANLAYQLLSKYDEDETLDPTDAPREYEGQRALRKL